MIEARKEGSPSEHPCFAGKATYGVFSGAEELRGLLGFHIGSSLPAICALNLQSPGESPSSLFLHLQHISQLSSM